LPYGSKVPCEANVSCRIYHLLFKGIHRAVLMSMSHLSDRVALQRTLIFHCEIYAAIRERKPQDARRAIEEHILDTRDLMGRSKSTKRVRSNTRADS